MLFPPESFLMKRKNPIVRQLEKDLNIDADEIIAQFKSRQGWVNAACSENTGV